MTEDFIYTIPMLMLAAMVIIEEIKIDRLEERVRKLEQGEEQT